MLIVVNWSTYLKFVLLDDAIPDVKQKYKTALLEVIILTVLQKTIPDISMIMCNTYVSHDISYQAYILLSVHFKNNNNNIGLTCILHLHAWFKQWGYSPLLVTQFQAYSLNTEGFRAI